MQERAPASHLPDQFSELPVFETTADQLSRVILCSPSREAEQAGV